MFEGLFVLWGIASLVWFWPVLIVAFLLLWIFSENEKGFGTFLLTAVVGYLIYLKWPAVLDLSWKQYVGIVVGYLAVGTLWTVFKWHRFGAKAVERIVTIRDGVLSRLKLEPGYFTASNAVNITPDQSEEYATRLAQGIAQVHERNDWQVAIKQAVPTPEKHKATIALWGIYWPTSVLWFLLNDFVNAVATFLVNRMGGLYKRITAAQFREVQ